MLRRFFFLNVALVGICFVLMVWCAVDLVGPDT